MTVETKQITELFRHPLLDLPLVRAAQLVSIEDRAAALLNSSSDVLFVGAEAVQPLEAVTASLGGPGVEWLNVVTSGYGRVFGNLLRSRGAVVHDLIAPDDRPIRFEEVETALSEWPEVGAVAVVHAESLTGIVNPLAEIAAYAHKQGALVVVDAVASAGAEPLDIDALGIDVCVIGPQKGWGGPSGASLVTVSDKAWDAMRANSGAPRNSVLSLLDVKERWIDAGRGRPAGTPPSLEVAALDAAISRLEAEGMEDVVARHLKIAIAVRAALRALGLSLWVADERDACSVATPVRLPEGVSGDALIELVAVRYGVDLTPGTGPLKGRAVRIDHMGAQASFRYATAAVAALGCGLRDLGADVDLAAAMETFVAFDR